jgi:transcriptional regulator GlxA family with amidase domain
VNWLLRQHGQGVKLVTICSGVFLVAATGLLDGRTVSTHRICAQAVSERFPAVSVDVEQRIIEEPDMLSAGGFMAWVDVGLLLIERLFGHDVRAETARFVLPDQVGGHERDRRVFPAQQAQRDPAIQRALEFVHLRDAQGVSLDAMMAAARLERRTFLRRFRSATGMAPIEYCRTIRIARAREFLEASNTPLKVLAETLAMRIPARSRGRSVAPAA